MGDFTGAKRLYITQDDDVNVIGSEAVEASLLLLQQTGRLRVGRIADLP